MQGDFELLLKNNYQKITRGKRPAESNSMRSRRKALFEKRGTFFWLLITAVSFYLLLDATNYDLGFALKRVVWPVSRLMGIMAGALFLSALIEAKGWAGFVSRLSRPLMKMGNLSDWSGTAFTTAFLSGIAASTMLWNAYQDGKISKREMFISALLNVGLPSYFLHLPITLSIIVPLVGKAGIIYLFITFTAALFRTAAVITAGRMLLKKNTSVHLTSHAQEQPPDKEEKKVLVLFRKYLSQRLSYIALYTVPIYLLVVLARVWGLFDMLKDVSEHLVTTNVIPVEGVSVVVFSIVAEFAAGAAAAGAMLQEGVLNVRQTVAALVLGNIIATPIRAIRHQLPRYLGIYRPAVGIALMVTGQLLRVTSVALAGGLYWILS